MAGSLFVLLVLPDASPANSKGGILGANYSPLRAPGQGAFGRKGEISPASDAMGFQPVTSAMAKNKPVADSFANVLGGSRP